MLVLNLTSVHSKTSPRITITHGKSTHHDHGNDRPISSVMPKVVNQPWTIPELMTQKPSQHQRTQISSRPSLPGCHGSYFLHTFYQLSPGDLAGYRRPVCPLSAQSPGPEGLNAVPFITPKDSGRPGGLICNRPRSIKKCAILVIIMTR